MTSASSDLKPSLGMVGITINAMVLIAPSAFLWTTDQLQSLLDSAPNMCAAIALATCVALLTASCYATFPKPISMQIHSILNTVLIAMQH